MMLNLQMDVVSPVGLHGDDGQICEVVLHGKLEKSHHTAKEQWLVANVDG